MKKLIVAAFVACILAGLCHCKKENTMPTEIKDAQIVSTADTIKETDNAPTQDSASFTPDGNDLTANPQVADQPEASEASEGE